MSNHITHMKILIVTNRRQHRQRILSNNRRERIIIKACKIEFCSATPENQHNIPILTAVHNGIKRRNYRSRTVSSLHQRREKHRLHREAVWVL